jgi:hypothetical protein
MALIECGPGPRRLAGAALAAGIGLVASACALAPGEFAQTSPEPLVLTGAYVENPAGTPVEAQPAVVVAVEPQPDQPPPLPPPTAAEAAVLAPPVRLASAPAAAGYPNISQPPAEPTGKLLSPEEKARVVAELEALAASQGEPSSAAKKKCDAAAAEALDPAQRLKSDLDGREC